MFKDITLGQYYPADSVIHKLDPRTKLFATIIYIVSLFVADGLLTYILATAFLAAVIALSKVPFSFMVRGLKGIVLIIVIAGCINLFLTPGNTILAIGPLTISDAGLKNAVLMLVRMVFLIIGTSVMTLTTTPNQLTDGLETSLKPLNRLHVPVHEIAMMMSIALRFIPILIEETEKITKAQTARGADFEHGNLIQKAKNMIPLLVPLFVSAFRRADELAMAMEARCYHGGDGRTKMYPLTYSGKDRLAYAVIWLYLAGVIVLKVLL